MILGAGAVVKGIVRNDFHPAARVDGIDGFSNGIEMEWVVLGSRYGDILEDFPWTAEIDDYCTF